jgi:2-methylcitrate dehydratase PrpD
MANETRSLAAYASSLSFDDIPEAVIDRAKQCIADTVAAAIFGANLPWSRMVADYAVENSANGRCTIIGTRGRKVQPGAAALAMGTAAHAYELDSLRRPGAGVHPGATLVPPALAMAQHLGKSGKDVIVAFVAGCEVLCRIGDATRHSAESRGFHAPGLTGPFGSAIVTGRLLGLNADKMTCALGIAGSLASGLLEFAKSGTGGMVKRLHLGRAAEGGILAATLAQKGFTGPVSVLEGKAGFLQAYCLEYEPQRLTLGLKQTWETLKICLKRYPCHITAHPAIEAARAVVAERSIAIEQIDSIVVRGSAKMAAIHNNQTPADLIMAQYSIPWCIAAALAGDALDPASFGHRAFENSQVATLATRISVAEGAPAGFSSWGAEVHLKLRDGTALVRTSDSFPGAPEQPLTDGEFRKKFMSLAGSASNVETCFRRLMSLEAEPDLDWLSEHNTNDAVIN